MGNPVRFSASTSWTEGQSRGATTLDVVDGFIDRIHGGDSSSIGDHHFDGACICPGFFDSHLHLLLGGIGLAQLDLSNVHSRGAFEAAITRAHQSLPPDQWIEARGWNEALFPADGPPTREWLHGARDRPTICWRVDIHSCIVNDAAIERMGRQKITERSHSEAPRENGQLTGILREGAAWEIAVPSVPPPEDARLRAGLKTAQHELLSRGVTSVGSMEYADWVDRILVPARSTLRPRMHITLLDRSWPIDCASVAARLPCEHLSFVGCKSFADGTLGSRTAWMLAPYADDASTSGAPCEFTRDGRLAEWMSMVAQHHLSPSVHAIGDAALRAVLDAAETARIPHHTLRIEHAQTVASSDLPRLAHHFVSMQPLHKADDARIALSRLGTTRMGEFFPFRSIRDQGASLAFGSDWPIASADPVAAMRTAITGRTSSGELFQRNETLSPEEALIATTSDAARSLRVGQTLGRLQSTFRADFTVLDKHPLECDWIQDPPRVIATIVGGKMEWKCSAAKTIA
ncbi:MAG: amidohydrolase family protein [Planctomycetota bacterium]|nr:amidohydrolase family protein [Planctomycetota bacterium]